MRSAPGINLRGQPKATRVLCPSDGCGRHIATLSDGTRLALRGAASDGTIEGDCDGCGKRFTVKTVKARNA